MSGIIEQPYVGFTASSIECWRFQNGIHDFINTEVRKELEADFESMGANSRHDVLLDSFPKRKWKLEIVVLGEVRMNLLILNSADLKTGRSFERLRERKLELREALDAGGAVIWPIVLLREVQLLVDGCCRPSILLEMDIPEAYGYVGRFVGK